MEKQYQLDLSINEMGVLNFIIKTQISPGSGGSNFVLSKKEISTARQILAKLKKF